MSRLIAAAEARLIELDDRARQSFAPYAETPPIRLLDLFSKLADQPELRMIATALLAAGTLGDNDRLVRAGARMMIAHEAATMVKDLAKTRIDRTRPRSADDGKAKKPRKGNHTAKERTSFPSGHSAGAMAAAIAFSREFPEYRVPALGTAALLAASQVPRCAHYPTDVVAGAMIGIVTEALTNGVWGLARMDERSADDD